MLRTAIIRTAASASTRLAAAAARPASAGAFRSANIVARAGAAVPRWPAAAALQTVRMYSAGSGLEKQEVEQRIFGILRNFDKVTDPSKVTSAAHFTNDLGLDSLDTVEVVMAIEEEFSIEIPDKDADGIHSVDKAVEYILSQPDAN